MTSDIAERGGKSQVRSIARAAVILQVNDEPDSISAAIQATDYHSVVRPVRWSGKLVKNVSKTRLVGGQWHRKGATLDLDVVNDAPAPTIPVTGSLDLLA